MLNLKVTEEKFFLYNTVLLATLFSLEYQTGVIGLTA